jgi:2-polyprenyl-3-methyl-5-hydroxy-6-metoxy-1,4-benzoquinol methylase
MINFEQRSYQKELLDEDAIPANDLFQNLKELNFINQWLGGHAITIDGFLDFIKKGKPINSLAEIGCGGGDNIKAILNYNNKKKDNYLATTGIDIKADCVFYAQKQIKNPLAKWVCSDYQLVNWKDEEKPDVIFSSLFCHHFTNQELIQQVKWMYEQSKSGFFINDLQRHPLAYYFIKWLTKLFSHSYLVKNDAPLSVLRGFSRKEWIDILNEAGIEKYTIKWKWAFRYLITVHK